MHTISDTHFVKMQHYLQKNLGLYYPQERKQDLERALIAVYIESGFEDVNEYIDNLREPSESFKEILLLAKYLTIGETYFFREPNVFDLLGKQIIPELLQQKKTGRKQLRIWSAGCCTGEEAYSIAILLHETVQDLPSWSVTILGTDINPDFLIKAAHATYRAWSFRNEHSEIMKKYFTRNERGEFKLAPIVRHSVQWNTLNLIGDQFPSQLNNTDRMDIIFCRNVLIYFSDEGRQRIISKFYDSLNEGGYLILSLTEVAHQPDKRFKQIRKDDVIVFKKEKPAPIAPALQKQESHIQEKGVKAKQSNRTTVPNIQNPKNDKQILIETSEVRQPRIIDFYILEGLYKKTDYRSVISVLEQHDLNSVLLSPYTPEEKEKIFIFYTKSLANLGKTSEAKQKALEGVSQLPDSFRLNYLCGHLFASADSTREAFIYYNKALFLSPGFPAALFGIASVYRQLGETEEYLKTLNMLHKIALNIPADKVVEELDGLNGAGLVQLVTAILNSQKEHEFI